MSFDNLVLSHSDHGSLQPESFGYTAAVLLVLTNGLRHTLVAQNHEAAHHI